MPFHPVWLIVVLAIILIVFGPKRLPELGSSLGRGVREFRNATDQLKEDVVAATTPETKTEA
ncbi:MAG TPA: twin-arginine translocase TatA/TatE family subunit [Candidatus Dormibacteraeota bacterium]